MIAMRKSSLSPFLVLLVCSVAWATDYSQDANCQGFWPMEDSGNESDEGFNTDNALTETSGTIPQDTDKKFGQYSRDFEFGDTEYMTHADSLATDINGANQQLSIVAAVNRESDSGSFESIVAKYDYGSGDRQYALYVYGVDDAVRFNISPDGGTANSGVAFGTTSITLGSWFHLAGVYDDTDMRMYVNGSLDTNGSNNPLTYTSGIYNGSAAVTVGCYLNSGAQIRNWDGLIDDVAIFDRALTAVEVADIANYGVRGTAPAPFFGTNF